MAKQKTAKMLPHSIEAEQAVLGCVLIDEDEAHEVLVLAKEHDFYSNSHKKIFVAMQNIFNKNKPVDFVTLTAELERVEHLNDIGGLNYITNLTNAVPSASNYKHYLEIVKRESKLRQIIKASETIIEKAFSGEDKANTITFAESEFFRISQEDQKSDLKKINNLTYDAMQGFENAQKNKGLLTGVPTDYYELDKLTNGLQPGDLILLGARPSVGKTSLALNIANNASINHKKSVAIFSIEMPDIQLAQRTLCSTGVVDFQKAKSGKLSTEDWDALWEAKKKTEDAEVYVDDNSLITPGQIISKCRNLKRKKGLDLIVIDYLQLMQMGGRRIDNRNLEISQITRALKIGAKELGVPIILLSQLKRPNTSENRRPVLVDLRDSGAIEQDADIVMFLHLKDEQDLYNSSNKKRVVELIIAKHRNGPTAMINLNFKPQYTLFMEPNKSKNLKSLEKTAPQVQSNELTPIEDEDVDDVF